MSEGIRERVQHEGSTLDNTPFEGPREQVQFQQFSGEFSIDYRELIKSLNSIEYLKKKMDEIAESFIAQKDGLVISKINEATERTGNVVDGRGRPFSPELLFEALEKMQIDFDDAGNPIMPTVALHPSMFEKVREKLPEWEANPEFTKRHEAIIEAKRREWLDRENRRKLAD